jgi:hypothetical protein
MALPESVIGSLGQSTAQEATKALAFSGQPWLLAGAIILVIAAIIIALVLKKIIVNSLLGIIAWGLLKLVFGVSLPFWASLIVSAIFGLAGIGVMLILRFFGMV